MSRSSLSVVTERLINTSIESPTRRSRRSTRILIPVVKIPVVGTIKPGSTSSNVPALINPQWDQNFQIRWEYLPKGIAECLNKGNRLNPRDKREFVRFVSRAITDVCPRPKRKNLITIIQKIVNQFPDSLSDSWCNETAGIGYESLLRKVVARIENCNRHSNPRKSYDSTGKKVRTPIYKIYGCSNWQPAILEDETDLLQKRNVMKDMYIQGTRNVDVVIKSLLSQTYTLQRKDINEGKDMDKLIDDWPFLFTIEGLLGHFNELVGVDVRSKLENTLLVKGHRIMSSMTQIADKCPKKEKLKETVEGLLCSSEMLPNEIIADVSGLLNLIMEYFEEDKGSIYVTVESAISRNELEEILHLQNISNPLLVVHGQSEFSYDQCMLFVNGKIVIDEIKSFKDAFIGLFCVYFCLNIDYPLPAAATLEFIQRCFFGINPEYGAKTQKRNKWKMNVKVTKLIERLSECD